ncbi:MAG: NAD(P)H-binding protein [Symploca sp. SIO3C6]|uniref:NAD(P)H-binding protein n=1 Tax=Symploca sp. SIO1C4 TaxID=2607765 RepID=A0A6B3NLP2_9CYAN|nr:NAD(P)H-binding protein [Symploca sp. SIO3C6]NER30491.1 NAD(P)H-binding protein [Symploca sp. SIO1C4]
MNLLIFGSTGGTGRQLVEQALEQGHRVTAFARNPAKLDIKHTNLKVVEGDVMDFTSVDKALQGQDVVVCVLGAGKKITGTIRSEGTRQIIHAMEKAGIRRFICQSTLGAGDIALRAGVLTS